MPMFVAAWETIEGPSEGSVAMDTSSPWGPESAESTAPSPWGQDTVQAATTAEQLVLSPLLMQSLFTFSLLLFSLRRQQDGQTSEHSLDK